VRFSRKLRASLARPYSWPTHCLVVGVAISILAVTHARGTYDLGGPVLRAVGLIWVLTTYREQRPEKER
jgi:hypothetical protein